MDLRSGHLSITGAMGPRRRGTRGPARSRERSWVCRGVHRPAKTASRRNHRSHAECAFLSRRGGVAGADCAFPWDSGCRLRFYV